MKKLNLFTGIAALAILASCSKSDDQIIPTAGNDEIRAVAKALSIDASTAPQSRAAYTDANAKNLKAYVLTSQTTGDYTTTYAKGTMTFDGTDAVNNSVGYETQDFDGNTKLPADKSSLFLAALYPATGWGTATTTAADYTFNGTQDVMAAPQMEIKKGGTEVAVFAFAHLLTKLDIMVKADDNDAITAWGKVQKIEITKVVNGTTFNDKIAVTLAGGTAATATAFSQSTANSNPWKTYTTADAEFTGQTIALTTTAAAVATTMMAPFTGTATNTDLELSVTTKTEKGTPLVTKVAVAIPAQDTQGKQYTINLNFKATDIKGTATVAAWGTTTPIDQDVE